MYDNPRNDTKGDTHSGVLDQAFSEGEAVGAFATIDVHGGVVLELLVDRALHHLVRVATTEPPIGIALRLGTGRRAAGSALLDHGEGLYWPTGLQMFPPGSILSYIAAKRQANEYIHIHTRTHKWLYMDVTRWF